MVLVQLLRLAVMVMILLLLLLRLLLESHLAPGHLANLPLALVLDLALALVLCPSQDTPLPRYQRGKH